MTLPNPVPPDLAGRRCRPGLGGVQANINGKNYVLNRVGKVLKVQLKRSRDNIANS